METPVLARVECEVNPVCSDPASMVEAIAVGCAGAMISVLLTPPAWAGLCLGGEGSLVTTGPEKVSRGQVTPSNFSAGDVELHYSSNRSGRWNKQGKEHDGLCMLFQCPYRKDGPIRHLRTLWNN